MQIIFVLTVLMCVSLGNGAQILISAPSGSKSHKNSYIPLTKELVKRGHNVTVICNYATADFKHLEGVREIVLPRLELDSSLMKVFDTVTNNATWKDSVRVFSRILSYPGNVTTETLEDSRVQHLLRHSHFDLVYVALLCRNVGLHLAKYFQAPVILFSPNVLYTGLATILGDSEHTEYVPFIMSSYSDQMNLLQRTLNTVAAFGLLMLDAKLTSLPDPIFQKYLPGSPISSELDNNVDLIFTNSHPSFSYPRALSPEVIEVGAMHCTPAKPLPAELEEFVSSAQDGFIVFSIGSILPMDEMPEHLVQAFVQTFSALPQRVIWQWKGKPKFDLPENVKTFNWLPQQDLLGHKNCRLFLTHGGLNSLQEAMYHGIPLLGLPFGSDQYVNLLRGAENGYALLIKWTDVTQETLTESIQLLLHNSSYSDSIKKRSLLLRDQIDNPLERAVFWVEFVLRHNGTKHLRLGSRNLSTYQRELIDVYAILILITVLPMMMLFLSLRRCYSYCSSKTNAIDLPKKIQ